MRNRIGGFLRSGLAAAGLLALIAGMPGIALGFDVPEIDPGSAASALTLLSGGVLWLTARRRG
jgi:hypothetical protein